MAGAARAFFASRWNGEVPVDRIVWIDMMLVGTLVNAAAGIAALLMLGFKHPTWVAMTVFLSPLPYNLFLVTSIWRGSAACSVSVAAFYRLLAAAWLAIATLL